MQLVATSRLDAAIMVVSPSAQSGAAGTVETSLATFAEAVERARPGDVIRMAGGTYKPDKTIRFTSSSTAEVRIRIEPADGTRSILDCAGNESDRRVSGLIFEGDYWHLVGLEVRNALRYGIDIARRFDNNFLARNTSTCVRMLLNNIRQLRMKKF